MRSLFTVLMAVTVACTLLVAPGVAASADDPDELRNSTATPTPENPITIQLSDFVTIKDWTFEDGQFRITVDSAGPRDLVVSDAMAVRNAIYDSGSSSTEIPRRDYTLEDGTQTIIFDAETYQGEAAISVSSREGAYLLKTGSPSGLFSGTFTGTDVQMAALGAAISVSLVIIYKTYRYSKGEDVQPERIA